jgi:phage/conjugal plasmid C-4 type zinc finger TraR family protein
MAVGWARDGAVQEQIDANVNDAVARARSRLSAGESLTHCEECEEEIPEARRKSMPGVRRCVPCQFELDNQQSHNSGYNNRRGSKRRQRPPAQVADTSEKAEGREEGALQKERCREAIEDSMGRIYQQGRPDPDLVVLEKSGRPRG